jgi:hypothetical protein
MYAAAEKRALFFDLGTLFLNSFKLKSDQSTKFKAQSFRSHNFR